LQFIEAQRFDVDFGRVRHSRTYEKHDEPSNGWANCSGDVALPVLNFVHHETFWYSRDVVFCDYVFFQLVRVAG